MNIASALSPLRSRRPFSEIVRELLRRPVAVIAILYLVIVAVAVFGSGTLAPHDPLETNFALANQPPSSAFLLGTDELGRDVLSRLMVGGIEPLNNVMTAMTIALVGGVTLGILAGYLGGTIDKIATRWAEVTMAIPALIILLVVLAIFPGSSFAAMVAFGVLLISPVLRVVRSATLPVRTELHVDAARLVGLSSFSIMRRHVLPRIMGPIVVQATLLAGTVLLFSTSLGFLGFGPPPPAPTWGGMVTDASSSMSANPWLLVPTGAVIILTVLAFNALGDSIRDILTERWAGPRPVRRYRKPLAHRRAAAGAAPLPTSPAAPALLEVTDLTVAFGTTDPVTVVQKVDLTIGAGETVGLVGESGCGKSVTGRALLGLLASGGAITGGSVRLAGRELTTLSDRELSEVRGSVISYISQDPMVALDPSFTIGKLVGEAVAQHDRLRGSARRTRVIELLRSVGLSEPEKLLRVYPHQISGGMAQRVIIARALAGRPALLIADEPTTALDVTVQEGILDLIRKIQTETGMSILFITHDWGVVADICDRAVVMYAGQVVEEAEVDEIFTRPLHPYTKGLLASTPDRAEPGHPLPMLQGAVPAPKDWPEGCHFAARCVYATPECSAAPVPLTTPIPGRSSRCVNVERLKVGVVAS